MRLALRSATSLLLVAAAFYLWQPVRDVPGDARVTAHFVPELRVEQLGQTYIEDANLFSENTRLRISLLYPRGHPLAGKPVAGDHGPIRVEEWVSEVYDGRYGATALPVTLNARNGEVELELKSLARYTHRDRRNAPVPRIRVTVGDQHAFATVPQWVDADGNGQTDWLERQVEHILGQIRASGIDELAEVLDALQGWEESFKMDCGGVDADTPAIIKISTVCLDDDLLNRHRLNTRQELAATVLHEAWHVWDLHQHRFETARYKYPRSGYGRCIPWDPKRTSDKQPLYQLSCPPGYAYDALYLNDMEAKAEAFASRYRHLFH